MARHLSWAARCFAALSMTGLDLSVEEEMPSSTTIEDPIEKKTAKENFRTMQQDEMQMAPQQHAQRIANMILQAQQECRADIGRINDPKAQALFETLAEVLGGAMKALNDFQARNEPPWQ